MLRQLSNLVYWFTELIYGMSLVKTKEDVYKEFNFSGVRLVGWSHPWWSCHGGECEEHSRGMLLLLVGRWVAPSGRDLFILVFTVRVTNINDVTENLPQKDVTSVFIQTCRHVSFFCKFWRIQIAAVFVLCVKRHTRVGMGLQPGGSYRTKRN